MNTTRPSLGVLALFVGVLAQCTTEGKIEHGRFRVDPLVASQTNIGRSTDTNLINPWGLAFGPQTVFWVANQGTGTATLYDGSGGIHNADVGGPIVVPRPSPPSSQAPSNGGDQPRQSEEEQGPTGLVFSGGGGFEVESGVPSSFVFATLEGTLIGWSAAQSDPTEAVIRVDNSADGASYTGLAIRRTSSTQARIFAANFATGEVEVYDQDFQPVSLGASAFVDPDLPQDYSPFGIHQIDGTVYVAYAQRDPSTGSEMHGKGKGAVTAFTPEGAIRRRIANGSPLNAPWGVARASGDFTDFGDALLIGNFGDGRITAYDPNDSELLGQLRAEGGGDLVIDGLWALTFGNGKEAGSSDLLYYTAGAENEAQGRFGRIVPDSLF